MSAAVSANIERQFRALTLRIPDTLLLFRFGNEFRAYHGHAETIRSVLTGHPGAGVLTIARGTVESAIADLVAAGHRVAICERVGRSPHPFPTTSPRWRHEST
jgi:DNA mismatch repair ATPase MutS